MSINALLLDGWDETSTWGVENGTFYAQLTPNGVSDETGPQVWIAPPQYLIYSFSELRLAIATATTCSLDVVGEAMGRSRANEQDDS